MYQTRTDTTIQLLPGATRVVTRPAPAASTTNTHRRMRVATPARDDDTCAWSRHAVAANGFGDAIA